MHFVMLNIALPVRMLSQQRSVSYIDCDIGNSCFRRLSKFSPVLPGCMSGLKTDECSTIRDTHYDNNNRLEHSEIQQNSSG